MQMVTIRSVTLAGEPQPGVDGRELHGALGVGREFANWMRDRIRDGQFEEGDDYLPILANNPGRGKPRTDYLLSLDMAKHVAMLERSPAGKACRAYFIAAEKRLRHIEAEGARPEPDEPEGPLDYKDYSAPLTLVKEFRILFGPRMAQRLWKHIGLPMPPVSQAEIGSYIDGVAAEADVTAWVEARLAWEPGARSAMSVLYNDYARFAATEGIRPRSLGSFGKQLSKLGIPSVQANVMYRVGVRLKG